MVRRSPLIAAVLAHAPIVLGALQNCGRSQYDPSQYVCWENYFLCPVTAGEPLSWCSGACYSKYMYTCANKVLTLLPAVSAGTAFQLIASNPTLPIHGQPITAGGLHWNIGGTTSSYCPTQVGSACPPGNITTMVATEGRVSMNVMVPGGQQAYLDPYWNMGYTQAHSAYIPPGSITTGFGAYEGGGFVNLNGNGWGWVACPPRASGGGGPQWNLVARNSTNAETLSSCTPINLKIEVVGSGSSFGAWQYT
ncbi:hypothetical protein OQA88_9273 [Cercophora sp. LCS_1]